jgi:hypothetical protein
VNQGGIGAPVARLPQAKGLERQPVLDVAAAVGHQFERAQVVAVGVLPEARGGGLQGHRVGALDPHVHHVRADAGPGDPVDTVGEIVGDDLDRADIDHLLGAGAALLPGGVVYLYNCLSVSLACAVPA